MKFTREFIREAAKESGVEIPKELEDALVSAHIESSNTFADGKVKESAERLESVQKELDELKQAGGDGWEQQAKDFEKKYNDLVAENQSRETRQAKEAAYRELLKAAGVSEKRLDSILRLSDVDGIELEDGKVKNADTLTASIQNEWADFITTTEITGAQMATPPVTNPKKTYSAAEINKMSVADINQNWDAVKASISKGDS